ncbi:MAG: hypothetical protein Q9226_004667 [Calogaya cf. arnoldii]
MQIPSRCKKFEKRDYAIGLAKVVDSKMRDDMKEGAIIAGSRDGIIEQLNTPIDWHTANCFDTEPAVPQSPLPPISEKPRPLPLRKHASQYPL